MSLMNLMQKEEKLVIGLMSGTSADGVDAALVKIKGHGSSVKVQQLSYVSLPFRPEIREKILWLMKGDFGGSREFCNMNVLLGKLYLDACQVLCERAGVALNDIDLIGSHGQTVYHQPEQKEYLGYPVAGTLQIGDVSELCEYMDVVAVSDFRIRDMAAGGQGAPLVPYTEYLIYKDREKNIALQNIGGMGNLTYLPADCTLDEVSAFDTGPGNVLIDGVTSRMTNGRHLYDPGGKLAAGSGVNRKLLEFLLEDAYLKKKPPKSTGREYYDTAFLDRIYEKAAGLGIEEGQILATVTRYTAETIALAVKKWLPAVPEQLIAGGGGTRNDTLMHHLRELLPHTQVVTNEEIGFDSDAKEAVAFAVLANETIHGGSGNVPGATGAKHLVVLGKISQ